MLLRWAGWFAAAVLLCSGVDANRPILLAQASTGDASEGYETHRASVIVFPSDDLVFNASVDLTDVSLDRPAEIDLILENRCPQELHLVAAVTGCKCRDVQLPRSPIKPGEFGKVKIKLTELTSESLTQTIVLPIQCRGAYEEIYVNCSLSFGRVAKFPASSYRIGVPKSNAGGSKKVTELAFLLSDMHLLNQVRIEASETLPVAIAGLAKDSKGRPVVKLAIDVEKVPAEGCVGELTLHSPYEGQSQQQVIIDIVRDEPIKISPLELVFQFDGSTKKFESYAIMDLQFASDKLQAMAGLKKQDRTLLPTVSVDVELKGLAKADVEVKAVHVNRSIYRLFVSLNKDIKRHELGKEGVVVVNVDGQVYRVNVGVLFF